MAMMNHGEKFSALTLVGLLSISIASAASPLGSEGCLRGDRFHKAAARTALDQAVLAKQQQAIDILKRRQASSPTPGAPQAPIPGGVNQVSIDDPDVVRVAEFAAADLARWRPDSMTSPYLHSIIKANKQVVAGVNYHLTIKTNDTDVYIWEVVVYEDLHGSLRITDSRQWQ